MVDRVRDLNKCFQSVIIAIKANDKDKENIPVRVSRFYNDDDRRIIIRYHKLGADHEKDVIFEEDKYILDCPQVGMTQVQGKVLYLRRIPERQWKRGYTESVVRSEYLSNYELREVQLSTVRLNNNELVNQLYNPTYTPMVDGISDLLKGKIFAFALSRKFAVGLKWDSKFPVVYYKEWVVGWVDDGAIVLPKSSHHLFEELSQYSTCRRM